MLEYLSPSLKTREVWRDFLCVGLYRLHRCTLAVGIGLDIKLHEQQIEPMAIGQVGRRFNNRIARATVIYKIHILFLLVSATYD